MRRIWIIETGLVPDELVARHGSYPAMFKRLIERNGGAFAFSTVRVCDGEALPSLDAVDGILITGSKDSVYDNLSWIGPSEAFVREAHRRAIPMVGVCFGHQLIAQALGGTVRKSERGWGIGRHVYAVSADNGWIAASTVAIACSHQDQVVEAPGDAQPILSSAFAPLAGLLYANGTTLSVQPHPEFSADYARTRCDARANELSPETIAAAKASLAEPLDAAVLGDTIARFLAQDRQQVPSA